MGTKIEWTDLSWNPLSGCEKISPGCKNCYAERIYRSFYKDQDFKNIVLHPDRFNYPFPLKPARKIFVGSMSDIMLAPYYFLVKIFETISQDKYKHHTFQILTKRPGEIFKIKPPIILDNIWFGISVENQEWADKRIPVLLQSPFKIKWLSCEPLLGHINLIDYIDDLDWIVVGGETGPHARPMHPAWVRAIRLICGAHNKPFFFKAWGEWIPVDQVIINDTNSMTRLDDDDVTRYIRLGKSHTGRMLDGQEWNQFPK